MTRAARRFTLPLLVCCLLAPLLSTGNAQAAFGLHEFDFRFLTESETEATQAGSHPYSIESTFEINFHKEGNVSFLDEEVKNLEVALPVGFAGTPTATPTCDHGDFLTKNPVTEGPSCPDSSAVGIALPVVSNPGFVPPPASLALYNLTPPPGAAAELGFSFEGVPVTIDLTVSQTAPYRVIALVTNFPQPVKVFGAKLFVWGNPGNPIHDSERGGCILHPGTECTTEGVQLKPFLTLPRACDGPQFASFNTVSWQNPFAAPTIGSSTTPLEMEGCQALGFEPTISAKPTTSDAESPTGLDFDLDVEDPGLTSADGVADSDIKRAVVTLPRGVTTNPAVASGLGGCTLAQYESETIDSKPGTGCPESSKVGSLEVETPLLEGSILRGSIYVAKQGDNPFNNLLTVLLVIKDKELGLLIRVAGKVEPNPSSGQLTTSFDDLPQLPFSHLRLHFRKDERSPLITPALCGEYVTTADLYPYSNPTLPLRQASRFEITSGAAGRTCASSEAQLPLRTSFSAGSMSPIAGKYSPFVLKLQREDGTQQLSGIATTLPQGLLGRLADIPYCPESGLAEAVARSGEGEGAAEIAQPSCPKASEVGTVTVGAGAGNQLLYVTGHAYLAGPYKGAPLSLEIITPAIAGPFDLGTVAVRTALNVDLRTAQVSAISDPIPTILHGLPLVVRSIAISLDRPTFTLNPTSCEPKTITGAVRSTLGQETPISQYFQVEDCGALRFRPTLRIHLKGPTRRSGHPALKAVLTYPKQGSYSNVARARVGLPHSEFLDQGSIGKVCTQPQLKAKACPKKSIYGRAKAWSPLLEKPLSGPVYLGVGYGHKLPDLVADLDGQIRVLLNGKVDTDPQEGIRNTFEAVPDAPVSKFVLELKGGPKQGLLENSENICRKPQKASVTFVAQNGRIAKVQQPIENECTKKSGRKKSKGSGKMR
jgi:hypothetical protein